MKYQLSTPPCNLSNVPRTRFTQTTLFTALASLLVGFGATSSAIAAVDEPRPNPTAKYSSLAKYNKLMTVESEDDAQLDTALDALRLKNAVEEGNIKPSVLEDYTKENINNKKSVREQQKLLNQSNQPRQSNQPTNKKDNATKELENKELEKRSKDRNNNNQEKPDASNQYLEQEALSVQQQGYQMMTPAEIEQALATVDILSTQDEADNNNAANKSNRASNDNGNTKDSNTKKSTNRDTSTDKGLDSGDDKVVNSNVDNNIDGVDNIDSDFDSPVSTLDSTQAPIGLDTSLDAAVLPSPDNLDTLGRSDDDNSMVARTEEQTIPVDDRPIEVSDAVSTNRVETSEQDPVQTLARQPNDQATGAENTTSDVKAQASTGQLSVDDESDAQAQLQDEPADTLNPEDYLPDYQAATETDAVAEGMVQASDNKPQARNRPNVFKRIYNRLFNGGVSALPHVETTVYLQQPADNSDPDAQPTLIEADEDIQPINNIKAALDDTTVQSVVDFTAALPRLRQTALDAARAVGYYDVTLKLRQPTADTIDVIIESLGEPVRVDSRIVEVRGEGTEQKEFQVSQEELPPQEGDIFNHRVYKNSKAALESLSATYGYFDQYWLNKSVDIILPDNTADVSLVYDTGERYEFDDVVFFTYDEESNTLTRDPDMLPVEPELLEQLVGFKAGDPFYRPAITKFGNDLSATRYFNTVNVETVLPPDSLSERGSLAFDNMSPNTETNDDIDIDGADSNLIDTDVNTGNRQNALSNNANANANANANGNDTSTTSDNEDNSTVNDDTTADSDLAAANGEVNTEATDTDDTNIEPIEFTVDEETSEKLAAIKRKAERLSNLPSDRVLDEQEQEEVDSILGRISNSISNFAEKIFPDDDTTIDEDFVPPTLEGRITPQQVQDSKKVPLYVFVSSEKPRDAQVGLGYGTDTDVRATGRIDYNLINRKGYQAGAEVEFSRIKKSATVYGSRPWKHPLNDKLDARLTYQEETIDQGDGNFDLSTNTLESSLARNIRRESGWDSSTFIRYRLDKLETGVDEEELEDLPVEFTSGNPKQKALLLGYGISKTNVDNAINPTRGYRQYYGIEAGSDKALSDTDMAIIHAGISGIYSFGEDNKHQVLSSLNTGYIWADDFYDVPYKLRFFAGGDQSLRGYDYESLSPKNDNGYLTGGQVLAVGSAEYNYEFRPGFRGAIFTDVGNAYDKDFDTETKVGVGVGIRWASPVGVVRVDVAAGVTEDSVPVRLHFFIGSPL